jgi:hypothetical protein
LVDEPDNDAARAIPRDGARRVRWGSSPCRRVARGECLVGTDGEGRFDGSNNGDVPHLHWVVGDQVFELAMFEDRFFDPGLLAKYMGFDKPPLCEVK